MIARDLSHVRGHAAAAAVRGPDRSPPTSAGGAASDEDPGCSVRRPACAWACASCGHGRRGRGRSGGGGGQVWLLSVLATLARPAPARPKGV